jgi:hypothetical protein
MNVMQAAHYYRLSIGERYWWALVFQSMVRMGESRLWKMSWPLSFRTIPWMLSLICIAKTFRWTTVFLVALVPIKLLCTNPLGEVLITAIAHQSEYQNCACNSMETDSLCSHSIKKQIHYVSIQSRNRFIMFPFSQETDSLCFHSVTKQIHYVPIQSRNRFIMFPFSHETDSLCSHSIKK